ncbi:MAG: hypothetical protein ACOCXT_00435 [Candidatus Dojkabacteria bacterium]
MERNSENIEVNNGKRQLLKNNLLMFVGGNIANGLNYLLNIILLRIDEPLFNLYTAYTSASLILLIPSLAVMRIFTSQGLSLFRNVKDSLVRAKNKAIICLIVFAVLLIPVNYILTSILEGGTIITSALLIILAVIGVIANIFRGLKQNEENYTIAVISMNLEAAGRLFLGFIFAVLLGMSINGILLGHILGFVLSMLICLDMKYVNFKNIHYTPVKLFPVFSGIMLMTAGLEFFANFDIVYADRVLPNDSIAQTEFNTLQVFRKIIFFGVFTVSAVVYSVANKSDHSKKFVFFFTTLIGLIAGISLSGGFILLHSYILGFLDTELTLTSRSLEIYFLFATTFMSTSYLLSNWLFTTGKKKYIYLPVFASLLQVLIFIVVGKDFTSLLTAFFSSSLVFFIIAFTAGVYECYSTEISRDKRDQKSLSLKS